MEVDLRTQIVSAGLPAPVAEHRFHETRKWRFDLCFPAARLAVEVQGGSFTQGKHTRGVGYRNDCLKLCEAQIAGWRVLWVTTEMVKDGSALALIERALSA